MNTDYPQNPTPFAKTLKQRIMRRVYFLFMVRNFSPLVFDCVIIVIAAFLITVFVSVRDVFSNFSIAASGSNVFQFSVAAVSGTKLQTKLMLVALGIAGFFGIRHLRRAVQAVKTLRGNTEQNRNAANTEQDRTR